MPPGLQRWYVVPLCEDAQSGAAGSVWATMVLPASSGPFFSAPLNVLLRPCCPSVQRGKGMCKGSHLMALVPTMLVTPADTRTGSREAREKPVARDEVLGTEAQAVRAEQGLPGAAGGPGVHVHAYVPVGLGWREQFYCRRLGKKAQKKEFLHGS